MITLLTFLVPCLVLSDCLGLVLSDNPSDLHSAFEFQNWRSLPYGQDIGDVHEKKGNLRYDQDIILSDNVRPWEQHLDSSYTSETESQKSAEHSTPHFPRRLDVGDFNKLLGTAVFIIDDLYTSVIGIKVWATNIICSKSRIDTLTIDHDQDKVKSVFDLNIYGLETICDFDWRSVRPNIYAFSSQVV